MCLDILTEQLPINSIPKPLIADHDIICYKVFDLNDYESDEDREKPYEPKLRTPYQRALLKAGVRYIDYCETDPKVRVAIPMYQSNDCIRDEVEEPTTTDSWEVGFGMIHSYARFEDAMNDVNDCSGNIIMYAIIPKGAKYYYGTFCGMGAYASSELIVTENAAFYSDYLYFVKENVRRHNPDIAPDEITEIWMKEYKLPLAKRDIIVKAFHIPLDDEGLFRLQKMETLKMEDLIYNKEEKIELCRAPYDVYSEINIPF